MEQLTIDFLLNTIEKNESTLNHNETIFNILEGYLKPYVENVIEAQYVDKESAKVTKQRIPPLNLIQKFTNKLSQIYSNGVLRKFESGSDQDLADYYINELDIDVVMSESNRLFNSTKAGTVQIYDKDGAIQLRNIPTHKAIPFSLDTTDPTNMSGIIIPMGNVETKDGTANSFWAFTDDQFISFTDQGNLIRKDMQVTEGENTYGVVPFSYIQKSRYELVPKIDTSFLTMGLLTPLLMAELNAAQMFLAFPILYGIDVDIPTGMPRSPNVILDLKSSLDGAKPELNVISPNLNITDQKEWIYDQINLWADTNDIKLQISGQVDSNLSGISMMVKNADTTENRKKQVTFYKAGEQDFWFRLATIHNNLVDQGVITNMGKFSNPNELGLTIIFPDQKPLEDQRAKVERLKLELENGLTSRESAIKEYHSDFDDTQIEKLLSEIDEQKNIILEGINGEATEDND